MKSKRTSYILTQVFMMFLVLGLFGGAGYSLHEFGRESQSSGWQNFGTALIVFGIFAAIKPVDLIRERMEEEGNFDIWKATVWVVSPCLLLLCYLPGVGPIIRQSVFGPDYVNPFTQKWKTDRTSQ